MTRHTRTVEEVLSEQLGYEVDPVKMATATATARNKPPTD